LTSRRLTVREAAEVLGVSVDAVRMRVRRRSLQSEKDSDGRVYVWVDTDEDNVESQRQVESLGVVEALREQVGYLQGVIATRDRELQSRSEEIRRRDLALEREQELTAMFADRLRELEAPRDERGSPQEAAAEPEREEPGSQTAGLRSGSQSPWWRRVFGG